MIKLGTIYNEIKLVPNLNFIKGKKYQWLNNPWGNTNQDILVYNHKNEDGYYFIDKIGDYIFFPIENNYIYKQKFKKLNEIKLINKLIRITPKGKEALDQFWELNDALVYFELYENKKLFKHDFQDDVFSGRLGKFIETVVNLSVIESEGIISFDQPIPKDEFVKRYKQIRGEEDDPFQEDWIKKMFKHGLLIEN